MFDKKVIDVIRFKEKKMMDEFLYQSWPDICVRKSDVFALPFIMFIAYFGK